MNPPAAAEASATCTHDSEVDTCHMIHVCTRLVMSHAFAYDNVSMSRSFECPASALSKEHGSGSQACRLNHEQAEQVMSMQSES